MNIPSLGPLHPDARFPEMLVSSPVRIPYFDGHEMTFTIDGLPDVEAAAIEAAIHSFLQLGPHDRSVATPYVFQNYRRMVEALGDEGLDFEVSEPEGVWQHVHPSEIFVSQRGRRDNLIYLQITAECDWEGEHGLQIVYRRGVELSRVSDQDGHLTHTDAYDLPEDQDRIG
jgi:hypothetical protein